MEIGRNVLHGLWDWMNAPRSTPRPGLRHRVHGRGPGSTRTNHYIHHTYTNIRGKDRDLGYEIMRIDPHQKWHPVQPVTTCCWPSVGWDVAVHDLDFEAIRAGEKPKEQVLKELKGIAGKARAQIVKDYVSWPLVSAVVAGGASLAAESGYPRADAPDD